MSETLLQLRITAHKSIQDYRKKANDFLILMENEHQDIKKFLIKLSDKTNPTAQETAEITLLKRTLRLNDSFNALILISLYAINDYTNYLEALEKQGSKNDVTLNRLLQKAKELANHEREHQSPPSMIS
ncbi:MAG: hypothetical protein ACXACF_00090 [Candidatus Hermodarchaeia archaeon]